MANAPVRKPSYLAGPTTSSVCIALLLLTSSCDLICLLHARILSLPKDAQPCQQPCVAACARRRAEPVAPCARAGTGSGRLKGHLQAKKDKLDRAIKRLEDNILPGETVPPPPMGRAQLLAGVQQHAQWHAPAQPPPGGRPLGSASTSGGAGTNLQRTHLQP